MVSANDDGPAADRRWALRRGIELDADITVSTGETFAAKVTDISEEGCMIRFAPGQEIARECTHEIKVTGLEQLGAYVVWAEEGRAGLTFIAPLHSSTVQNLVMKSLYARLSRRMAGGKPEEEGLAPRGPFPFEE